MYNAADDEYGSTSERQRHLNDAALCRGMDAKHERMADAPDVLIAKEIAKDAKLSDHDRVRLIIWGSRLYSARGMCLLHRLTTFFPPLIAWALATTCYPYLFGDEDDFAPPHIISALCDAAVNGGADAIVNEWMDPTQRRDAESSKTRRVPNAC